MSGRLYCSFCGKSAAEVDVLVAGPVNIFICSECVEEAVASVARRRAELKLSRDIELCAACIPTPLDEKGLRAQTPLPAPPENTPRKRRRATSARP